MEIIQFFQQYSNPLLDQIVEGITMMGEDTFFIVALTFIYWCVSKEFGYKMGMAYLFNGVVNGVLKETFKVQRPIGRPGIFSKRLETATGYSFPSGHTQSAASFWTSMMLQYKRRFLYILGSCAIVLVAVSRLYLGVHMPKDVIVGAILGILCTILSNRMYEVMRRGKRKSILLVLIIPILAGGFVFSGEDYFKAAGVVVSIIIGYILESTYINYQTQGTLWQQAIKYIIGITVALMIKVFIKHILPQHFVSDFFRYFLLGLWVIVLAPLVFKKLFGKSKMVFNGYR